MGDNHGNLIHLFERDCSAQRRNQKLIEETPASSKLAPDLRRRLANLAVTLGQRIGYNNAGTVEFLVSRDGSVYFLEMNTRLQVEHGVSEMITAWTWWSCSCGSPPANRCPLLMMTSPRMATPSRSVFTRRTRRLSCRMLGDNDLHLPRLTMCESTRPFATVTPLG